VTHSQTTFFVGVLVGMPIGALLTVGVAYYIEGKARWQSYVNSRGLASKMAEGRAASSSVVHSESSKPQPGATPKESSTSLPKEIKLPLGPSASPFRKVTDNPYSDDYNALIKAQADECMATLRGLQADCRKIRAPYFVHEKIKKLMVNFGMSDDN
jgi:hypothetical protein